ncbi:MAG TPA: pyridoxal-phosphate dependent enzyme [Candidatus Xenobia bacterium]|nr:pyridoxal-phosphate dependent enzyme [Candidatus Xenobia bacterium]
MRCKNILEAVGKTPLVRLNRLTEGLKCEVYVKVDYLNPGGSVKDRIAITMIDDAERRGLLKPGGTIIEGTSGNTGMGLALVAAVRGYKAIFTITDKQSKEKIDLLKALGAEVIVCPTAVEPADPRSYYSVARRLAQEIPNSYYPNQYENPMNPEAHYQTTGPEIWDDTEGRITHFVIGLGTGGTVTGVARYLKERNPDVKIIGVDPIGSLYYEFFKTGKVGKATTYVVEGIGEDFFPKTCDLSLLDDIIQVDDKTCMIWTRKLARQEAIFTGGSGGGCVWAALQVARQLHEKELVVAFLPDTGMRYLSKIYNDEWMRDNRYLEEEVSLTADDLVRSKAAAGGARELIQAEPYQTVYHALRTMQGQDISQLPIFENGTPVGAIYEDDILQLALHGRDLRKVLIREVMGKPFPIVPRTAGADQVTELITAGNPAVFIDLGDGRYDIVTKYDIVRAVARLAEKETRA